jgi:hypothetical protein
MYFLETDLGEIFKPRPTVPAKPPAQAPAQRPPKQGWVVKDGHRRFCGDPSGRSVSCDLNLKVRFRRSFDEFLRELAEAYGRWMARPTARMLVKKLQNDLKQWHQEMLSQKLLDNDPINFVAGLNYRRSNGTWLVDDSSLRQWWRLIDL